MLRKKSMSSPEKQPRENPLTSMSIDTENNNALTSPSPLLSSETTSKSQPSTTTNQTSTNTNLPLLSAAYLSALTTGATTYAFSFYSSALKLSLHLTQSQLDTLGSATFAAGVFSWIPGMIVDRYGSKLGIITGGMGNVCVLSLYWFIATGRLWKLDQGKAEEDVTTSWLIFVLSLLAVLTFMGCALITGSVFKLIVESCGKGSKGKAVGCAKGYVGVGSGVYVCLFRALFGVSGPSGAAGPAHTLLMSALPTSVFWATKSFLNHPLATAVINTPILGADNTTKLPSPEIMNTLNFLLMAACLSFLAAVVPALIFLPKHETMKSRKPRDGTRSIHFRVVYAGLVLLGMWVVGTSLLELKEEEDKAAATKQSKNSGAKGVPSPIVPNRTVVQLTERSEFGLSEGNTQEEMPHQHYFHDEFLFGSNELDDSTSQQKVPDNTLEQIQQQHELRDSHDRDNLNFRSQQLNRVWKKIRRLQSSSTDRHWGTAILLLLLWWGPALSLLVIPPRKDTPDSYDSLDQEDMCNEDLNLDENGNEEIDENEQDTFLNDALSNRRPLSLTKSEDDVEDSNGGKKEFTLAEMLRTGKAWLMAWTFLVLVGGGTLMTCNIGQMTEALGFDSDVTPASLALFSAAQGASRVVTGSISESALTWNVPWLCSCFAGTRGVARPAFLVLASLVSAIAHFTLAVASTQRGFAFGVTLSGWAFGMTWPMMVLITGEVFGTAHVGANYMFFDGFSSAMGTLLLSKFVAQYVYDEHIIKGHGDSVDQDNFQCYGKGCFQMSHVIVCLLSLTCVLSSFSLMRATRDIYRR